LKPSIRYLDLADVLLVAESVLGVIAGELLRTMRLDLAESALGAPMASFEGHEFYPTFSEKAAVLCPRLVRNHPFLDGNKRVGYMRLIEFVERNGYSWTPPLGDGPRGDETVDVIERVATGELGEAALAAWIAERISRRA